MEDDSLTARLQPSGRSTHMSWQSDILLNSIIEHLPVAIFAKDVAAGYRISLWNRAAEELFGLSAEQMVGFTDYDLFPKDKADYFRATDERVMQGRQVVNIPEEEIISPRGTWLGHTVKVPIYDRQGRPAILLGIIEDISSRKAALESDAARVRAEQVSIAKSEFLAHMSHELRTPLNSVIGLADLMLTTGTKLDAKQKSMLTTLSDASRMLLKTVNEVLDLSKIEAGHVELEILPFDANDVFRKATDLLRPIADDKHIELIIAPPRQPIPHTEGDGAKLMRVLTNLLGNAIKYTEKGHVSLRYDWCEQNDGTVEITAEIEDTGIGIPPEKHEAIFGQFAQADASIARTYGGTGLGLSITRQLIELMGGNIGVESEPGHGARFWFTVVLPRAEAPAARAETPAAIEGIPRAENARILLAEDNEMNQLLMRNLLEAHGFPEPDIAADGEQAVMLYDRNPYDLILMDCQMPNVSGYEATETIRTRERQSGRHTPIIALTANVLQGERDKCFDTGMDDYIPKPLEIAVFHDMLARYFTVDAGPGKFNAAANAAPVDMDRIRQMYGNDQAHIRHLAAIFERQSDHVLKALHAHCVNGISRPWCETAHFLKGTAATLNATHLSELCEKAQQQLDATADQRRALLIPIEAEIRNIHDFFAAEGLLAA